MTTPKSVVDSRGNRWELDRRIGEGGQGSVYLAKGGRMVVKLINSSGDANARRLERQIMFVRNLDLKGIAIAQPQVTLAAPNVGYVMEMLQDMTSIHHLMNVPAGTSSTARWYTETGGLRRRLRICANAAEALAMLHLKGLCYGDVSAANIFVAIGHGSDEVRLIDSDNLRFESDPARQIVYTPGFGAPEVVDGYGSPSSLSDAFGLAVVTFKTLTMAHPLIGDATEFGDPDLEERALAGHVPWIDHPTDPSNRSSRGISPRECVLSRRLRDLAEATFGSGLRDPNVRPSAADWAETLSRAHRNCIVCKCGASFYRNAIECPWCTAQRPEFATAYVVRWDAVADGGKGAIVQGPDGKPHRIDDFVLSSGDLVQLDAGICFGTNSTGNATEMMSLVWDRARGILTIDPNGATVWLRTNEFGQIREMNGPQEISHDKLLSCQVHLGPPSTTHRVLVFGIGVKS